MARQGCGLMQESKDIQPDELCINSGWSCGLMQESKDIQHYSSDTGNHQVVV